MGALMDMHNHYMIAISVFFALVSMIMIFSIIRHRRACVRSASKFSGTTGATQWFWVLVPLAILAFINFSMINADAEDHSSAMNSQHLRQ
jgi:cytochrome c oxidase subunit 2